MQQRLEKVAIMFYKICETSAGIRQIHFPSYQIGFCFWAQNRTNLCNTAWIDRLRIVLSISCQQSFYTVPVVVPPYNEFIVVISRFFCSVLIVTRGFVWSFQSFFYTSSRVRELSKYYMNLSNISISRIVFWINLK